MLVMIVVIMLGVLLRAEASATSNRFRNAGAANRCCCDPRSTTESAEKAPATLRLISSGSVYAITARPMMPLLHTRAEGASERTAARRGAWVVRATAAVAGASSHRPASYSRTSLIGLQTASQPTLYIHASRNTAAGIIALVPLNITIMAERERASARESTARAAMKREREATVGEDQMCRKLRQEQEQARKRLVRMQWQQHFEQKQLSEELSRYGRYVELAPGMASIPLLERKLFLEHVDFIGAELPAGWEIREVPLTETCACDDGKECNGSKSCTHCGCCTRGACRSSGDFYIHRGAGMPGMFCLDCADHVGTGDVGAAARWSEVGPVEQWLSVGANAVDFSGRWILSGDAGELCEGFVSFDAARRLRGLDMNCSINFENGKVLLHGDCVEPNTLGRSGNLIEYETEHVLNGRLVLGTLAIGISRNPEEYKYNGGALSGHFQLFDEGEGETDVIMSLRRELPHAAAASEEVTVVGQCTLEQRNRAGFANAILL